MIELRWKKADRDDDWLPSVRSLDSEGNFVEYVLQYRELTAKDRNPEWKDVTIDWE